MSLRDEAKARQETQWTLQRVLNVLAATDEDDEFLELLADPTMTPAAMMHALRDRGIMVGRAIYTWCNEARNEARQ